MGLLFPLLRISENVYYYIIYTLLSTVMQPKREKET